MIYNPKISIIIRTKNEERWISQCIKSIQSQNYKNYEIIIVDNFSKDRTVKKAKLLGIKKIVYIKNYLPGKALNLGINKSIGEIIVCLSAHCIPKTNNWLKNLIKHFKDDDKIAGIYGRQEPMEFSKDSDKRDLFLVFGLDKKIQIKDSFFHNANSAIKKNIWKKIKFDDKTTNIEDRLWAQKIIKKKYKLVYEPLASVYHYHGIHQDGNKIRLNNVVNIIQSQTRSFTQGNINPSKLNIIAIIPSRGPQKKHNNIPLISHTIKYAKKSKFIKKIIVSTDNRETMKFSKKLGAEIPFLRPKKFSALNVNLRSVQKFTLMNLEKKNIYPDLVVHLEETYPFRDNNLIDESIKILLKNGFDTVIAAKQENDGWIWKKNNDQIIKLEDGDIPSKSKNKIFLGLQGVCCVTYPEFIRKGLLFGEKIGLYEINNKLSYLQVKDIQTYKKFYKFIK